LDTTFVALLRAAMTSESAADTMRRVFAAQVAPALAAVTPDHPAQRAGLMGAFVIGLATTRYVVAIPAVANLNHEELIRFARPVIRQILFGPI
ncbi:TetR family transcriptional regulator, partial [Mycobacterium sp. ITM-2017-0098]